MHELPLLIFTLFLQGSVGVTLWLAFGSTQRSALLPAAGAFVLASLGLLASALHMGYPLNALNALRHVSSSWLSREIIFASLYLAALGFATLLMFVKKPGYGREFETQTLGFAYENDAQLPDAYERVLVDAISSHKNLFTEGDEVLRSWQILQPLLDAWALDDAPIRQYQQGSAPSDILDA